MKAKSSKMLALAVIIGLCAVAIIGAAYAAFAGTAKTYNEDNNIVAGNILITNGDYDPMASSAKEIFSTYTYNDTTEKVAYYAEGASTVNSLSAVALGSAKELTVTNNTGAAITTMTVGAKASTAISTADYTYFFAVTVGSSPTVYISLPTSGTEYVVSSSITVDTSASEGTQSLADGGNVTVTLQLYVGYTANVYIPNTYIGNVSGTQEGIYTIAARNGTAPADIADVDFGFVVADVTP